MNGGHYTAFIKIGTDGYDIDSGAAPAAALKGAKVYINRCVFDDFVLLYVC